MAENSNLSSSPTNSPIRLSEYLPRLLHFTLSLSVQGIPELSSALPTDFCSKLLQNEPQSACIYCQSHHLEQDSNSGHCLWDADDGEAGWEEAPVYPLYKKIASALSASITSGAFIRESASMRGLNGDETLALKMDEWIKMIVKMGSHLTDVLESAKFHLDVQEPFFSQLRSILRTKAGFLLVLQFNFDNYWRNKMSVAIEFEKRPDNLNRDNGLSIGKSWRLILNHIRSRDIASINTDGKKTVEGRCARGNYKTIFAGDLLLVNRSLLLTVQAVNRYNSFYEMIEAESIEKVLPGIKTVEEGVQVYRRFYTEEREKADGVLAIVVSRAPLQPYIILSDMFSELNVEGVRVLLGLRSTTRTIPDAVPPPR